MEEKINELQNQIKVLQDAYDNDLKREINEENDQIQANRQKGIHKLQEELKEVEIEKLSNLEERKTEIEEILKKKESLSKDKEQLEQAIYEMNGENEIQDGKLTKSQEQIEYEKDLEKVNDELNLLEPYDNELSGINNEIGKIKEKYNINEKEKTNTQMNKESAPIFKEPISENKKDNIITGNIDKAIKLGGEQYGVGTKIGDNIENILQNDKETSMTVYKKPNKFVTWIKDKFNIIKDKFSKSKNKEELDATGQAWQDYIDEQEGTTTSKKNRFIENITQNGKLQSKEQQEKIFESVKKWEQQNKNAIEQENDDREQ